MLGTDIIIARMLNHVFNAVLNALFAVFGMVLLKMIFKRERLAVGVAIGLTMVLVLVLFIGAERVCCQVADRFRPSRIAPRSSLLAPRSSLLANRVPR